MHLAHKTPFRPDAEVSQSYNSGVVTIYAVSDGAAAGRLPAPVLTQKIRLDYEELKLGVQRYYQAKQNHIHVERVIRVPRPPVEITNQDEAITEDGRRYRIDLIQNAKGVWPTSLDLTLTAYTQRQGGNAEPVPGLSAPVPVDLER
jgi:hypothetical protein